MKRAFVLLRTAECDLDGIVEYLQAHAGRSKAVEFVERIHASFELLAKRPISIARIVHQARELSILLARLPSDDDGEPVN